MTIYGMLENDMYDIKDTAYHEAWHRLQSYFLTPKEMRVLNNAFSREKLKQYAGVENYINNPASIEMQAFAFQNYARLRDFGWKDPARAARRRAEFDRSRLLTSYDERYQATGKAILTDDQLNQLFLSADPAAHKVWTKFTGKLMEIFERFNNWAQGNGFQNVNDIFERAYSGRMAKQGKANYAWSKALENTPDGIKRSKMLEFWIHDNDPEMAAQILNDMADQLGLEAEALRTKAMQEGC